jgi:hypothetical protein
MLGKTLGKVVEPFVCLIFKPATQQMAGMQSFTEGE